MKKLLTILVLIMLIISFFQITSMYALYKEELESEYSTLLGVWAIKVNGTEITSSDGQTEVFTISDDNIGYVISEYVQSKKIAPGSQAYFDIEIDPTNTDVSIKYTIDLGTVAVGSNDTSNANIELISAENYFKINKEDENEAQVTNETDFQDGNSYTSVIPVEKITQGYKNYIRLYFEWVNNEDYNETDSALAEIEATTISVPAEINLIQYTGEVIGNESE